MKGHLAAWSYFQTLDTPRNKEFVKSFQARYGKDRVVYDAMAAAYTAVHVWKIAREKAGSFDVDKVREALIGQKFKGPAGMVTMQENHHLINNAFIGETLASGQFKIIKTMNNVAGEPFSEKFLGTKTASN
jgi:urea transport system substrate-binding protein